jgi:hypothetical protein
LGEGRGQSIFEMTSSQLLHYEQKLIGAVDDEQLLQCIG